MKNHFFDVGANIGQTFDDFLCKTTNFDGWDVWCFEPSPRHIPELMCMAQQFSGRFKTHVCPFGIVGTSLVRPFHQKDDPRGDSFEPYLASDHLTKNMDLGYNLRVFSAGISDAIQALTEPGDAIVLKLDCEGSEYSILRQLLKDPESLHRCKQIYVEFHHICEAGNTHERDQLISAFAAKGIVLHQWMF